MPAKVKTPPWPVGQLATFELRDYRRELEHAIERTPEQTAERETLGQRLAEVLIEEETRAAARTGGPVDLPA